MNGEQIINGKIVVRLLVDREDHKAINEIAEEEIRPIQDQYRFAIKQFVRGHRKRPGKMLKTPEG